MKAKDREPKWTRCRGAVQVAVAKDSNLQTFFILLSVMVNGSYLLDMVHDLNKNIKALSSIQQLVTKLGIAPRRPAITSNSHRTDQGHKNESVGRCGTDVKTRPC